MSDPPADSPPPQNDEQTRRELRRQRWKLFYRLEATIEKPMIVLAIVWLILMIVEFTQGLGPLLLNVGYGIWAIFIADFLLRLGLAPRRAAFLRRNWLTLISLLLPAVRVLRVFRALRAIRAAQLARPIGLARVITSLNRSLRALNHVLQRRGLGYVVAATVLVIFGGAAGMTLFETPAALRAAGHFEAAETGGLASYSESVWWTAMIMTTLGSDYWPKTLEGRILAWLLSLYALAIFGYITASIASAFLEPAPERRPASSAEIAALRRELTALREELARHEP